MIIYRTSGSNIKKINFMFEKKETVKYMPFMMFGRKVFSAGEISDVYAGNIRVSISETDNRYNVEFTGMVSYCNAVIMIYSVDKNILLGISEEY